MSQSHRASLSSLASESSLGIFLAGVLVTLPVILFLALTWGYYINAPLMDDFDSILYFMLKFVEESSATEQVQFIFAQHNEHRLAFSRGLAVGLYSLTGKINFALMAHLSTLALILLPVVIILSLRKENRLRSAILLTLPTVLLAFQPQPHESFISTTISTANTAVLVFAALSLLSLDYRSRSGTILALVFLPCAIFSQGNGVVLFPVGLGLLLLQRRWKEATLWVLVGGLLLWLYFFDYAPHPRLPGVTESMFNVKENFYYTLYFVGAAPSFRHNQLAFFFGIGGYLLFAFLTLRVFFQRNAVVYGLILFLLGSIWVNALSRSLFFGAEYPATQNRYYLYSAVIWGLMLTALMDDVHRFRVRLRIPLKVAVLGIAVAFAYQSFTTTLSQWPAYYRRQQAAMHAWAETGEGLIYPWQGRADRILSEAIREGLYRPPEPVLEAFWRRIEREERSYEPRRREER